MYLAEHNFVRGWEVYKERTLSLVTLEYKEAAAYLESALIQGNSLPANGDALRVALYVSFIKEINRTQLKVQKELSIHQWLTLFRFVWILLGLHNTCYVMVYPIVIIHYEIYCSCKTYLIGISYMYIRPGARGVHHAPPPFLKKMFFWTLSVHNKKWDVNSKNIGTHYWFTALF